MPPEQKPDETKWGLSQMNSPAPLWYRRITNAIILCFLPVYTGFVDLIRMSDYERQIYLHIGVAIPFMLKGFAIIMGNGQAYFPSNMALDKSKDRATMILFLILTPFIYSLLK